MYLKKSPQKNGRVYLSIVDGYYDKNRRHSRTVTIEKLGYLDDLKKIYDDPIAFFSEKVQRLKQEKALQKAAIQVEFSPEEKIDASLVYRKNFGYSVLRHIYHELELDKFFINRQRSSNIEFNANNIMKLLVFSRLLNPGSKRKTFDNRAYKHIFSPALCLL